MKGPSIVVGKQGGLFRIVFRESTLSPADFNRPRTFNGHGPAIETADQIAKATGWPVIDETAAKGGNHVPA